LEDIGFDVFTVMERETFWKKSAF